MKRLLICIIITASFLAGIYISASFAESKTDGSGLFATDADNPDLICGNVPGDPDLPIPYANDTPDFISAFTNTITWEPVDDDRIERYRIEVSWDSSFEIIQACPEVLVPQTSRQVTQNIEDTVWYRVRSAGLIDSEVKFSYPSNIVSTIQDTTSPRLDLIEVSSGGSAGDPTINVYFEGEELYPHFIEVKDNPDGPWNSWPIDNDTGTVTATVSLEQERKVVYVRMVDKAGNRGDSLSDTLTFARGSHSYPNPFNPYSSDENLNHTNLVFRLEADQEVTILIYDLYGNLVHKQEAQGTAGINDGGRSIEPGLQWDGRNDNGQVVADGGYICVIKYGDEQFMHKIAVIK